MALDPSLFPDDESGNGHKAKQVEPDEPPFIPKDVLEYLERVFPEPRHGLEASDAELRFEAGRRNVIQFIQRVYEQQSDPSHCL